MFSRMQTRAIGLLGLVLVSLSLLGACGEGESQALQQQLNSIDEQMNSIDEQLRETNQRLSEATAALENLEHMAQVAQVSAAIQNIDGAGFHGMDEGLANGEMNPRWGSTVGNVVAATEATAWPEALHERVDAFLQDAKELEAALDAEDMRGAAQTAAKAHDTQHALSHSVYAWLSGGEAQEHGHGNSTGTTEEAYPGQKGQIPEDAVSFTLELREDGSPEGGQTTLQVKQGDTVVFILQSQVQGSFHVHGYNREWDITSGEEAKAWFVANATGRFPLEIHVSGEESGVPAGYLEVQP